MLSILIENVPATLHRQLKKQAELHHRSMNREIIAVLESAVPLPPRKKLTLPVPIKPRFPMSTEEIEAAIADGQEPGEWFWQNLKTQQKKLITPRRRARR